MIWVKCADKGLEGISFWNMSAAAGIGATSISTIEGTLRSSRFYDSKYPLEINWIMATELKVDVDRKCQLWLHQTCNLHKKNRALWDYQQI